MAGTSRVTGIYPLLGSISARELARAVENGLRPAELCPAADQYVMSEEPTYQDWVATSELGAQASRTLWLLWEDDELSGVTAIPSGCKASLVEMVQLPISTE